MRGAASAENALEQHDALDGLPADRASIQLPRALFAGHDVPAEAEDGVHVLLVADPTQHLLLVCDVELHDALAVAESLFPAAREDVARFGVHHRALTVGLVVVPVSRISVSVGILHGAVRPCFAAAAVGAVVSGTGDADMGGLAVRAAIGEWSGEIRVREMGTSQMIAVV